MKDLGTSQRRWHPLLQEWVVIAAQTQNRPWSGEITKPGTSSSLEHDASCYLCPMVKRASGEINPDYAEPFVFENDFASFTLDAENISNATFDQQSSLFKTDSNKGLCKVICFSPKHNTTLAKLNVEEVHKVVSVWKSEFKCISQIDTIKNVLIFENKGKVIGVSNEHPHGQIYATSFVPRNISIIQNSYTQYHQQHQSCLMCDLIKQEKKSGERIVLESDNFIVIVPFFARFAYECFIIPKRHHSSLLDFGEDEELELATIYKQLLVKYDRLFAMDCPNISSVINSPFIKGQVDKNFHMYFSFAPPLRDQGKLKYLAGFESAGGNIINPVAPEAAAQKLREVE